MFVLKYQVFYLLMSLGRTTNSPFQVLYVPAYYDDVKTTGAKLARIIERPLERKLPYDVDDVLPGTWTEDGRGLVQVFKVLLIKHFQPYSLINLIS